MADNVTFETGTARVPVGTVIGADDVGGVLIQRVKLTWGGNGIATDVDSLTATALPVFLMNPGAIGGSGGTALADEGAFTFGTTSFTPIGAVVTADSITGSTAGALRMTTARGLHSHIVGPTGTGAAVAGAGGLGASAGRLGIWNANEKTATTASLSAGSLIANLSSLLGDIGAIIGVQAAGVWAGDLFFEATIDNTNFFAVFGTPAASNTHVSQTTANGAWIFETTGWVGLRVRASLSSGTVTIIQSAASGGNTRQAAGSGSGASLVSITNTVSIQIVSAVTLSVQVTSQPEQTLTGSYVDGASNAIRTSATSASRLVSLTNTVSIQIVSAITLSVQITTMPEVTLTGSYIDGASNAVRTSATAASRLISLTGSVQVSGISTPVSLTGTVSVQITSMPPVSLTGSFVTANNTIRVEGTLTFSAQITSMPPVSLTGSYVNLANNAIRVETTLTVLTETRFAAPATSKLTRANFQFSTTASSTLVAGVGGQTIRLMKILFTTETAMTFQFESSTSAISSVMRLPTDGGMILDLDGEPWYVTSTADPLRLHANNPASIGGTVWYTQS